MKHLAVLAVLVVCLWPGAVAGQETQPFMLDSPTDRKIADYTSTVAVGTTLALDVIQAWKKDRDRGDGSHRFLWTEVCTIGMAGLAAEGTKRLVHRERPNGVDDQSYFSMHEAFAVAAVNAGWSFRVNIPLAIGVGLGRAFSGYHYWSDIASGALDGWLSRKACEKLLRV